MTVRTYLDCGCALLEEGGRTWCPICSWEIEKFQGEQERALADDPTCDCELMHPIGQCREAQNA